MTAYSTYGISGQTYFTPRDKVAGKHPVVLAHGMTGNARSWLNVASWNTSIWTKMMALAGFNMLAASFGDGFGAPSESADMEACRGLCATAFPWCDSSKLVIVGMSMGHMNALGYRRDHPTRVAGILGIMGAVDITAARAADNPAGVRAGTDAAWGVVYPAPLPAPALFMPQAPTLKGIPYRMYGSTADTIALAADAQAFAAAMEGEWIQAGVGAHGDAIMADVPIQGSIDFLRSCGA